MRSDLFVINFLPGFFDDSGIYLNNGEGVYSKITEISAYNKTFAVGNFNGDKFADIFRADGFHWSVAEGSESGTGEFHIRANSEFLYGPDLIFGDFNGDGKTDEMRVHGLP